MISPRNFVEQLSQRPRACKLSHHAQSRIFRSHPYRCSCGTPLLPRRPATFFLLRPHVLQAAPIPLAQDEVRTLRARGLGQGEAVSSVLDSDVVLFSAETAKPAAVSGRKQTRRSLSARGKACRHPKRGCRHKA